MGLATHKAWSMQWLRSAQGITCLALLAFSTVGSAFAGNPVSDTDPVPDWRSSIGFPIEFDTRITNVATDRCIHIYGSWPFNGYVLGSNICATTDNERLWFDQIPNTSYYRIRLHHSGKCIEAIEPDANLEQWICHNGDFKRPDVAENAQHWDLQAINDEQFNLVSVSTGQYLTLSATDNGYEVKLREQSNADDQAFAFRDFTRHETNPGMVGSWGPLIAWPHVPVHAGVTPENTVVTWASNEGDAFPQSDANKETLSSVYNPDLDSFLETDNPAHDMFCAGVAMLEDGSLMAVGGNPRAAEASRFDSVSNSWTLSAYMQQQRWYSTNVTNGDGDVFATFAKGAQKLPELFSPQANAWQMKVDAEMTDLRNEQDAINAVSVNWSQEMQWYAFMHTAPDGRIFHGGPTPTMHLFDTDGEGAVTAVGARPDGLARQFGSSAMYDVGKLLVTGGSDPRVDSVLSDDQFARQLGASDTAISIDITGATPRIESVAPMNARRSNHNAVVLPTGEVFVVGGTAWGLAFDDRYSSWWPEIWDPDTDTWRNTAAQSTPRNYHSWALLLQDARIISGGGGLCGDCDSNHADAQIFTPAYLYREDGTLADRPEITDAPSMSRAGARVLLATDRAVADWTMIRLSATTHSVNTDQRLLHLDTTRIGQNLYTAKLDSNVNVLIPGMYWVFAIDDNGVPSVGHLLQIKSTDRAERSILPAAMADGMLQAHVSEEISLVFDVSEFDAETLRYTMLNMPEELSFDESYGRLNGSFDEATEGAFVISVTDGTRRATERVGYAIAPASDGDEGTEQKNTEEEEGLGEEVVQVEPQGSGALGVVILALLYAMTGYSRRCRQFVKESA